MNSSVKTCGHLSFSVVLVYTKQVSKRFLY